MGEEHAGHASPPPLAGRALKDQMVSALHLTKPEMFSATPACKGKKPELFSETEYFHPL